MKVFLLTCLLAAAYASPAYYGPPAPLNPDGSVAPTAEFAAEASRLAAAHQQEHQRLSAAAALAAAHPDNTSPQESYNNGPSNNNYNNGQYSPGPSYNPGQSYNQGPSYNPAPSYNNYNPAATQPAPLNPDGTVAETPEIQALKASHLAAHQQALQSTASYGPAPYQGPHYGRKRRSASLNPDGTVALTPEVAAATAAHYAALQGASPVAAASHWAPATAYQWAPAAAPQYAHTGVRHTPPAPLNPDGTVAEEPAVQALAAEHHAAYSRQLGALAAQASLAAAAGPDDSAYYHSGPAAAYAAPSYHGGYAAPAPLNPDGTVAHTPEYLAVAASHRAPHSG